MICNVVLVKHFFSEEIKFKIQIISKTFSDLQNVNVCACLFKYPNLKIDKLVSNWKKEAMEFEQPSKFHFLAYSLKVDFVFYPRCMNNDSLLINVFF